MRIGFLYNHHTPHQVLHTAPVAFSLSRIRPDADVRILASCRRQLEMARRIGAGWPGHRVRFDLLEPSLPDRLAARAGLRIHGGYKRRVLMNNRAHLRALDALVVPERTSSALRRYRDLDHLQLIQIPHGAGDRAVGYEARNAAFDLLLVAGDKCRQRLVAEAGVDEERIHVIGYPKFEACCAGPLPELFPNRRPTVLYNPHFEPHLSSWGRFGWQVLEWFARQQTYNLIFAPHIMLYERPRRFGARRLDRFENLPHIHIDTGSDRCVDMTYTRYADIYLGDVSSQVYEFIVEPRPAVFLNAHGIERWREDVNFYHWSMGTVVDDLEDLESALALPLSRRQASLQRARAAWTYYRETRPPSELGALSIVAFLQNRPSAGTDPACRPPAVAPCAETLSRAPVTPAS